MVTRHLAGSVDLTIDRVVLWTFFVILFIALLEFGLQKLVEICHKYEKYHEMLNKVTGELMIVGLIYLIVKLLCYFNIIAYGGLEYYALDAADMLLFFVVIGLVLQSIIIFVRLRISNARVDSATITTTSALVEIAENNKANVNNSGWFARQWASYTMYRKLERKLLDAYFHDVHKLPTIFSFSKYLREVQDTTIVDLIEIDILGYSMLLVLFLCFFACTGELQANTLYRSSLDPDSSLGKISAQMDDKRKCVFKTFAWVLTGILLLMAVYLKIFTKALVNHAKYHFLDKFESSPHPKSHVDGMIEALKCASIVESQHNTTYYQDLNRLQELSDHLTNQVTKVEGCFKSNLIVQLISSLCCKSRQTSKITDGTEPLYLEDPSLKMPMPYSRIFLQFCLKAFLIVNGLYYSMLISCIVPSLDSQDLSKLGILLIPLLINSFWLAPLVVHKFAILDATWDIDPFVLAAVLDHIRDVEELNVSMVKEIREHLADTEKDVDVILKEMELIDTKDGNKDGYIEIDSLRRILTKYGFKLSRHKFHTLVLLKYQTKGTTVKFEDILHVIKTHQDTPSDSRFV
ncbi:hypothetical protein THRCLA_07936 [Thraustotheca clavata]|uniref:EF-hand domain-containing protein n=1 Tax=Thraustotheca clavata TaxID=74557 RepID=A0A1V9ZBJ3_9STRA|nr:hypothetical protein THRCLA_07936 [Thraustotheca clavata]